MLLIDGGKHKNLMRYKINHGPKIFCVKGLISLIKTNIFCHLTVGENKLECLSLPHFGGASITYGGKPELTRVGNLIEAQSAVITCI